MRLLRPFAAGIRQGLKIDLAIRGPVKSEYAIMQTDAELNVAALRANVGRLRSPQLVRAVLTAMDHAGDDMNVVRKNLENWFDSGMDRVSGQYKRFTHFWLFVIGVVLAAGLNVNAITITNHLARNKALRESIVARSAVVMRDSQYQRRLSDTTFRIADARHTQDELNALDLPIGIERYAWPQTPADWIRMFGGIFITAFAVTLGAPFWFDALNKMMVIRSTVKPHEKSREESSEDRQTSKDRSTEPASAPAETPAPRASGGVAVAAAWTPAPRVSRSVTPPATTHESQEWASGHPDEGIL